ncbi:TetR/AcrR family transcriptional regulator [Lentzea sp. JNUCC 0626]|uniref:TetR/AcrR family transcriptional regulator n=1 Tax=Lentzea sp. JNUCC 0626 TaxID=3367513 RepID=UPI003748D10C
MPRGRGTRLTREAILDACMAIAKRAAPEGLTGGALGQELGVDRSAAWRHFPGHDALLTAVGDRLLLMAAEQVQEGLPPEARLRSLARHLVDVFVAHPYIGAQTSCRMTRGPGELAVIELVLTVLEQACLRGQAVAHHQQLLTDTLLAYAGLRATYATLHARTRVKDGRFQWFDLSEENYPAIIRHLPSLSVQNHDGVLTTLLDTLWATVIGAAADDRRVVYDRHGERDPAHA